MGRMTGRRPGRDRLRELLDAVLDEDHGDLAAMARGAHTSPFHLSRSLSSGAGESPVAMRRRVMLERAAWQLRHGTSVTDAAWAAGYGSTDGFSRAFTRAFGCAPSRLDGAPGSPVARAGSHWLPAPNGIHFHPPTSLWVRTEEHPMAPLTQQLVEHDLDDTAHLLRLAAGLPDADYRASALPAGRVLDWDGPEESVAAVLEHQVRSKEVWVAAIVGEDQPPDGRGGSDGPDDPDDPDDAAALAVRHEAVAPRWLEVVRDVDRRGAWDDRIVDALCDPPESFVLSSVVAHVLTYGAHRRQLVRYLLRGLGHEVDHGDPITWSRGRGDGTGVRA
jgi:AraC-like DNA-binding protein